MKIKSNNKYVKAFIAEYEEMIRETDIEAIEFHYNICEIYYNKYSEIKKYFAFNEKEKDIKKRFVSPDYIPQRKDEGFETPRCQKGLYLIGSVHCNPITEEIFYWVKIGKTASSFCKRMSGYNTHNPMVYKIDFAINKEDEEERYHFLLARMAIEKSYKSAEWFRVTKEQYLAISKDGFEFFE